MQPLGIYYSGVLLALGSNICLAVRNTGIKYFIQGEEAKISKTSIDGFAMMSFAGFLALLPLWLFLLLSSELSIVADEKLIEYYPGR